MIPPALRHLESSLRELDEGGLLRSPQPVTPGSLVLCSNDYLGYARAHVEAQERLWGAGSSRLVSGESDAHGQAERALAGWLGTPAALLFSSGYAANVGVLSALAGPGDAVISDALNHASIVDGCRLSRAKTVVVPHLDTSAIENALRDSRDARRRWVVTESYFSMDADTPDLPTLRRLCDAHDAALIVDEAHALGIFGPNGAGLCARAGVRPDVLVGTLGKAFGLQGAFVAGPEVLRTWLWNRARSFVFSTGFSPALAQVLAERAARVRSDDLGRERLHSLAEQLRATLAKHAHRVLGYGPILPWLFGTPAAALAASKQLLDHGIFVPAIRPPTVPPGASRLRVTASAALSDDDLRRFEHAVANLRQ
jgi:8-amino-7-oxononanoate synthase